MNNYSTEYRVNHSEQAGFKSILLLLFLFLISFSVQLKAQDPEFSQFYANPLYLNPAFTGTSSFPRAIINYRNQWPKQGNTFTTYNITFDKFINSTTGGIGFKTLYDRQLNGVINSFNTSFIYAEHFNLSDDFFISMALESGFIYRQFNTGGLIFPGMIDQGSGTIIGLYPLPVESGQKLVPDFSFGTVGQVNSIYFGIAIHHLTQPDMSILPGDQLGKLPMKLTLHIGAKGHEFHNGLISREFTISPNLIYRQQGNFKQINGGIYMKEDWLTFGLWYRNNLSVRPNAIVAVIGYQSDKFQFGYSFDFSFSKTSNYSYGSHELSMVFFFGEYHKRQFNNTMVIPQL